MPSVPSAPQLTTTPSITEILADPERLVPEKTAAEIIGLSNHRTLSVWRCNGTHQDLPYLKIGGYIRYRVRDLVKFRESKVVI